MAKQYKGSLTLEWYNKQKAIVNLDENGIKNNNDIPAPQINWINKDEALFYEISEEEGKGNIPYWVDRNDIRVKESRPLVFQKAFRAISKDKAGTLAGMNTEWTVEEIANEQDATDIENMLIKGDNLLALNTLKKHFEKLPDNQKVKCIYIDPPYNTGAAFTNYDDNFAHSEWLTLMRDRLTVLKSLLSKDGVIVIHIDDKEFAYVKILCDDIFGKENFLTTFIWETDGNSDNQAKFINVHEYILAYAFDIENIEYPTVFDPNLPDNSKLFRDNIINTVIKNGKKNPPSEIVLPIGFPAQFKSGVIKKDEVQYPQYNEDLIIENNQLANEVIAYTGWSAYSQIIEFINSGLKPIFDTKGQETTFSLKDTGAIESIKKRDKGYGYVISVLRKMGNTQKMAKELKMTYNVDFDFPKPESLASYILKIFSNDNDLVLDCFGGSGTTFAVAEKIKRRWIGIEIGNHADTHIIPRMNGVIAGTDQIGISQSVNWQGGGAFKYYHLGSSIIKVDSETGKGEFNWTLGKKFIQESLLASYDFILQPEINLFPSKIFQNEEEMPSVGKLTGKSNKSVYGVVALAEPSDSNLTINNEEVKTIYSSLKKMPDFQSVIIYTNKGIDIAQDTMPNDLEIIKVPHAVFAELER